MFKTRQLARIGGKTLEDLVKAIMKRTITNTLAAKYNFKGRATCKATGVQKMAFSKLALYRVIIGQLHVAYI